MAALGLLLRYQWRAYWRGQSEVGSWSRANLLVLGILGCYLLARHLSICVAAAARIRSDTSGAGVMLVEMILVALLLTWILLSVLVRSMNPQGSGWPSSRLALLPLRGSVQFLSLAAGTALQPAYWLLIAGSMVALIPLAALPHPATSVTAGLIFVLLCALIAWSSVLVEGALLSSRRAREASTLVLSLLLFSVVLLMRIDVHQVNGAYVLDLLGRRIVLLAAGGRAGVIAAICGKTPASWVVRAGTERGGAVFLLPLLGCVAAAFFVAVRALRRRTMHPVAEKSGRGRRRRIAGLPGLRAPLGAAAEKELRYLTRTLDSIFCFGAGIAGAAYLLLRADLSSWTPYAVVAAALSSELAMPVNAFGLDGRAADRYRILPLTGREVVLSKNIAWFALVVLQAGPIWLAAAIRMGAAVGAGALFATGSIALLGVLWGNVVSVRIPARREFYSMDSKEQSGGIVSILVMLVFILLPLGLAFALHRSGTVAVLAGQAGLFVLGLSAWWLLLDARGRGFENRSETMHRRLAG